MHEFRIPTHNKRYDRKAAGRLTWMVVVLVSVILVFMYVLDKARYEVSPANQPSSTYSPAPVHGVVYRKPEFSLSYVEKYELPEWVSYTLTADRLNQPKFERNQDFNPDPQIRGGSGHYRDYKSSGYRRGHLVPAGDMAWNKKAMDATFLLSNVAPMREAFNDGIWLELENNVRDWARKYKKVNVIAGPVFSNDMPSIGDNQIAVPRYYFKSVFTIREEQPQVIGFLIRQDASAYGPLSDYIISIDSLERLTGIELYENLYGSWEEEIRLEKSDHALPGQWPFNPRWYEQRLEGSKY
jgi:endonuclease G